jgi:hypothetical protein
MQDIHPLERTVEKIVRKLQVGCVYDLCCSFEALVRGAFVKYLSKKELNNAVERYSPWPAY